MIDGIESWTRSCTHTRFFVSSFADFCSLVARRPAWLKVTPEQVVDQICKLAKKGATPSQIGVVLRDSHGVAQVKVVTGELQCQESEPDE